LVSKETDNQLNILSSETSNRLTDDNPPQQSVDRANIEPSNTDETEQLH
jgi:hypothetical protein